MIHIPINWNIVEPICAGIAVSLINRFIFNNNNLWSSCCSKPHHEEHENAEQGVIATTTVDGSEGSGSNPGCQTPYVHTHVH